MAANSSLLGLLLSVVLSLFAAGAEEVEVMQPQRSVSALRGTDFTLECSVSNNEHLAGPVKWFMGKGPTRKPVYSATTPSDRVTRTEPGSDSDFSISIHNAAPEDVGTYYCVKQRTVLGGEVDWRSGAGTELAVREAELQKQEETPGSDIPTDKDQRDDILPAVVGTVCILLAVLISVALYIYVKKKRGKKGCSSRSEGPSSENTGTPHQTPPDKEIVYVDVKHTSSAQRPKQSKPEEHSTYATIR